MKHFRYTWYISFDIIKNYIRKRKKIKSIIFLLFRLKIKISVDFSVIELSFLGASPTDQDAYPQILEHPQNGYLARDNPATLSCQADGNPKPTITWYHNGRKVKTMDEDPYSQKMLIEGGKLFFLRVIHQKDKSDAGVYYCNATNILGSAISRNATLEIAGNLEIETI